MLKETSIDEFSGVLFIVANKNEVSLTELYNCVNALLILGPTRLWALVNYN